jgi:hypothetical protein
MSPFIYKGAGKNGSPYLSSAESACVKNACLIQKCLARNGSREENCKDVVDMWKECVKRNEERLEREDASKQRINTNG